MAAPKLKLWQLILGGPFLLWAGWDTYKDVSELEEHGGSMWVGRTTKFMYDLGGKWGILIGTWCLAAVYFYALWAVYRRDRAEKAATVTEAPAAKPKPTPKQPVRASQPIARASRPIAPPPIAAPPVIPPTPPSSEPRFLS
jgi:hypothetical protein